MWCNKCSIETSLDTCEICGNQTEPLIPQEIFWCEHCKTPILIPINGKGNAVCPHCKSITPTRTERSLSFKNSLLFCVVGPIFWGISQIFRNKDLNCYDANHYCLKCNASLGNYRAC